mgnify:CR=1 FL=1
MKFFYEIFIRVAYLLSQPLRILSPKTNLFFKGRKNSFKILKEEINSSNKNIWFHVSSLGEFEIAKPIIAFARSLDLLNVIKSNGAPKAINTKA